MGWRERGHHRVPPARSALPAAVLAWICLPLIMLFAGPAMAASVNTATAPAASLRVDPGTCAPWARWEAFKAKFISADGRVIDLDSSDARTVSEGQAYGLFLALVANDRPEFDKILDLTQNILAQGDLTKHLMAWLWGKRSDSTWGVIDDNSASDADLWLAYSLLQAGLIWHERRYTALGTVFARRILDEESARVPGLGWSVLPGKKGFHPSTDVWRFNPSYVPLQVLRGLEAASLDHDKLQQIIASSVRLLIETAPRGFSPDWAQYHSAKAKSGFAPDKATNAQGSYNAIRVYLWAGMLDSADPEAARLLKVFQPMADYVQHHGAPPEQINTVTGKVGSNDGNAGFSASLVPFLQALGKPQVAQAQVDRTRRLESQIPSGYYSQVLSMFGLGWYAGRFRFRADGSLSLAWENGCVESSR
jgi:endoglucanase